MATGLSEPVPGLAISLLSIYGVLLMGTMALLWRRRYLQPLKFREISLLLSTVMVTFMASTCSTIWIYVTTSSCFIQVLLQTPFVYMTTLIMARFWKLFLASRLTNARLVSDGNSWIMRFPWMASSRNIWRGTLFLGTVLALIQFILAMASVGCVISNSYYVWASTLLMMYWGSIAIMTWMLLKIEDGFFVVKELKMLGLVILVTNVLAILMFGGFLQFDLGPGFFSASSMLQMMIQTWYPLWKSYLMAQARDFHTTVQPSDITTRSRVSLRHAPLSNKSSFLDILRHPDGFEAMKQFLTLEFSVENILCWEMLHIRKQERRPDLIESHFMSIYETFVRDGSPNEVNINSQLKQHFQTVATGGEINLDTITSLKSTAKYSKGTLSPDQPTEIKLRLLKQLYHEIVKLMEQDSYARFLQSKIYSDLIQSKNPEIKHFQSSSAEMKLNLDEVLER